MKLTEILKYIPGLQIPLVIAEHRREMRALENAYQGYLSAERQNILCKIYRQSRRMRDAPPSEASGIEKEIASCSEAYERALMQ